MASFLVDTLAKRVYISKYMTRGASAAGIDHCTQTTKYPEHRCAFSWHIWEHSVQSPESLALNCGSTIGSKGSMALQSFNGLQWFQWGSKASRRSKGSKAFKGRRGILRGRKARGEIESSDFTDGVAEMQRLVRKCCKITTNDNNMQGEIDWGVAEMQHPFFVAQQCVSLRHSKTQHLVWKKTNNFNDLTAVNRLTAVVRPQYLVV